VNRQPSRLSVKSISGHSSSARLTFIMLVDSNTFGLNLTFQNGLRLSTPAEATNAVVLMGWSGFTGGAAVLTAWDYIRIQRPLHRNRILYWLMAIVLISVGEG